MQHNILLTGVSGYLGGSLLAQLGTANLPPYNRLYALVRSDVQAQTVRECSNATPLVFDVGNETVVRKAITDNEITIILFLIDASSSVTQSHMIRALADVKERTGKDVHFIHVRIILRAWQGFGKAPYWIISDTPTADKWSKTLLKPRGGTD